MYVREPSWWDGAECSKELGVWENTLLILTSDHGEELCEHGSLGHRLTLNEEQLRVSLLAHYPKVFDGGRVLEEAIRLIDVAPTIAEVTDVPVPKAWRGISLRNSGARRDFLAALEVGAEDGLRGYAILEGERKWIHSERGFYRERGFASRRLYERYAPLFTGDRSGVDLSSREPKALEALGY